MSDVNMPEAHDKDGSTMDPNFQDILRVEFAKLHREYRNLENKRRVIAHRDGYIHKKTDRLMPLLEREETELENEMKTATCKSNRKRAERLANDMKDALKTFDMYQQEVAKKIKQIAEIERQVDRITDKVVKQRIKMLAMHGLSKTMPQREHELAKAEDKLYHYTCAFNVQIHENKKLREEIMDYLMERSQFLKLHNNIKRQLAHAKKQMLNVIQQAVATYDNRDEAMSKVKALREREAKELKQHGMEVQEFERTLHRDKSILQFIRHKLKSRPEYEDDADRRVRIGSAKERELDAILKKYRQSFKKILAYSNTQSILDLVDKYNRMDANNFEGCKYITDLNNECEVLRKNIESLKSNIEDAHTVVESRERDQRQSQQQLQLAIISKQEEIETMQVQIMENKGKLREIFATISDAIELVDCNTAPILRLLGNQDGINEHNIRLCLAQLDIKITEMKCERDRLRDLKTNSMHVTALRPVLAKTKQHPTQGGPFAPKAMVFHGESVDEEDAKIFEQEPYYMDEMREYVLNKALEEKIIDPSKTSLSLSSSTRLKSQMTATTTINGSRQTLVEKVRQSHTEVGGKRRLKRNQVGEPESNGPGEVSRGKTGSTIKLGTPDQNKLTDKRQSNEDQPEVEPPFEEEGGEENEAVELDLPLDTSRLEDEPLEEEDDTADLQQVMEVPQPPDEYYPPEE